MVIPKSSNGTKIAGTAETGTKIFETGSQVPCPSLVSAVCQDGIKFLQIMVLVSFIQWSAFIFHSNQISLAQAKIYIRRSKAMILIKKTPFYEKNSGQMI